MLRLSHSIKALTALSLVTLTAACGNHAEESRTSADNPRTLPANISSFVALGDSVMAGYGVARDAGQVPLFHNYLAQRYAQSVALKDLSTPGATSQSILDRQVAPAVSFIRANADKGIVTAVDAGGNDLLAFMYSSAYQSTCAVGDLQACYASVSQILDRSEQTLTRIFSALRQATPAGNPVFVLTYANARSATGCATAGQKPLFEGALEGVPQTGLSRGLNDRIRELAAKYEFSVVDVYKLLQKNPDATIAKDCIHPNASGYRLIYQGLVTAFEAQ